MGQRCDICDVEQHIMINDDGSIRTSGPNLYYEAYTERWLCSKCLVRAEKCYETFAWSCFKYGQDKIPTCLK